MRSELVVGRVQVQEQRISTLNASCSHLDAASYGRATAGAHRGAHDQR